MAINIPCYNCKKRKLHCHSNCEEYLKFKKQCEKRNIFLREKMDEDSYNIHKLKRQNDKYNK